MHDYRSLGATILMVLSSYATAADRPVVILGGDVGHAASHCIARFRFAPFDSLPWLRADLTGEVVSQHDGAPWGHVLKRPFKNYSGDISGRFLEIMAMNAHAAQTTHPAFEPLLREIPNFQRPGGYFCASGVVDWQLPIDHPGKGDDPLGSRMLPALWGNARLLCGLVESMRAFPNDQAIALAARQLGDFYLTVLPRFNDPGRVDEYTAGGTYAAGYVTCWFPAMEGLVKLGNLSGEIKYIDAAAQMAAFYQRFDQLPVDHAHGMLCNHMGLLLLHEQTGDKVLLARVEHRWDELVQGGYINPAGGILEKCRVNFVRDEGCGIVDWLRLNLELGRLTGKARYWEMAERTLHNHFLQNQGPKGGFGHRQILCDDEGAHGIGNDYEESTWCCSFHGELGFTEIRRHLLLRTAGVLSCYFAMDFSAEDSLGVTTSVLLAGMKTGEVMRQRISLAGQPASVVRVRHPHWAATVTAVDPAGAAVPIEVQGMWFATSKPLNEVEFIYSGGVYAENRRCERLSESPLNGESFVIGYGPSLLVGDADSKPLAQWPSNLDALRAQGWEPLGWEHRGRDFSFVVSRRK